MRFRTRPFDCRSARRLLAAAGIVLCAAGTPGAHAAFQQTDLASDLPGLAAHQNAQLVDPWGIAAATASSFWIANHGSGVATVHDATGASPATVIAVPPAAGSSAPSRPTGVVLNSTSAFPIFTTRALAIFATETGTVSAWNPAAGSTAVRLIDNSAAGSRYTGLTLLDAGASSRLYAADFGQAAIHTFDASFSPLTLSGNFLDPGLPAGYAPFNVQELSGTLYVTYAQADTAGAPKTGAGLGLVNAFDTNGNLLRRLVSPGTLDAPWGLALASATFAEFPGALLVGSFGDGIIRAFDPATGTLLGALSGVSGDPIVNAGLHGLRFGDGPGGAADTLYFTAGIAGAGSVGDHGLFGSLAVAPVPEPAMAMLFAFGLAAVVLGARVRRD
jgi:uncharacterized protein (TIGR03118 family)